MNIKSNKIVLVDFNSLFDTDNENFDENYIPTLRDGAYNFLKQTSKKYNIQIMTSKDLSLASKWLKENDLEEYVQYTKFDKEIENMNLDKYDLIPLNPTEYEFKIIKIMYDGIV